MGGARTWKAFDRDAMDRLHENWIVSDPASKTKPALLTELTDAGARAVVERFRPAEGPAERLISPGLCGEIGPIDSAPVRLHGISPGTRRRREE